MPDSVGFGYGFGIRHIPNQDGDKIASEKACKRSCWKWQKTKVRVAVGTMHAQVVNTADGHNEQRSIHYLKSVFQAAEVLQPCSISQRVVRATSQNVCNVDSLVSN